jgi:hypothetical protein
VIGPGGAEVLLGLLHLASPLGLLREQEVEGGLEDLLGRGARLRVSLSRSRGLELLEELLRHGHVEAAQVGGEGLGLQRRRGCSRPKGVGRQFNRLNC